MRAQLDRVEKLERATGANRPPFDAIHHYLYAPSESGPLLVGAYGPFVIGCGGDVKPIHMDRESDESEAEFLARADRVFGELQVGAVPPIGNGAQAGPNQRGGH